MVIIGKYFLIDNKFLLLREDVVRITFDVGSRIQEYMHTPFPLPEKN